MQTEVLVERYQQNMFAAALSACKDPQDAEDAVQEALLAYHTSGKEFESEEHIRAWLLRVAINKAKNMRMSFWKKHKVSLEDYMESISFEIRKSFILCFKCENHSSRILSNISFCSTETKP